MIIVIIKRGGWERSLGCVQRRSVTLFKKRKRKNSMYNKYRIQIEKGLAAYPEPQIDLA